MVWCYCRSTSHLALVWCGTSFSQMFFQYCSVSTLGGSGPCCYSLVVGSTSWIGFFFFSTGDFLYLHPWSFMQVLLRLLWQCIWAHHPHNQWCWWWGWGIKQCHNITSASISSDGTVNQETRAFAWVATLATYFLISVDASAVAGGWATFSLDSLLSSTRVGSIFPYCSLLFPLYCRLWISSFDNSFSCSNIALIAWY